MFSYFILWILWYSSPAPVTFYNSIKHICIKNDLTVIYVMRMFLPFSMTSLTSFNDAADTVKLHAKTGYYSDYILFHYSGVLV